MKRFIAIIVVFNILVLTGCQPTVGQGPSIHDDMQQDVITLRFVNSWGGADSNAAALQRIFDQFEDKYPHIRIQNEATFGGDFLTKLKTDFATGNDPDVFGIWPGSDMDAIIEAGKAADLTDLLSEDPQWSQQFFGAWDYCTVDDRIYGLPVEIIYEALFINKEIFDKYDVNPPKTYEDLVILVRLFSSKGIIPIAYNHQAEGTFLYQNIVAQMGGLSNEGLDRETFLESMMVMKELYDRRAFPEDAYQLSNAQRNALFLEGQAAMIVQGSWFTRDIYEAGMAERVDIVPFPVFDKSHPDDYSLIYGLGCGTFFISSKAYDDPAKQEAAVLLLRELTSPEASIILTEGSGFISNVDIRDGKNVYPSLYSKGMDLVRHAQQLVPPMDSMIDRNTWENVIVPSFYDVYRYGKPYVEALWDEINVS